MAYDIKITKNIKKNVALCKRRGYQLLLIMLSTGTHSDLFGKNKK